MDRRNFLTSVAAAGAAGAAALAGCRSTPAAVPPGELLGTSLDLGHRLRDGGFAPPGETRHVPVLIVGAGIAGLSAGWKLAKAGFADFLLVELENEAGGNSRAGGNAVSAYPWGAHYLPLPTREATAVRELLAELGVLQGDPRAAKPTYDERYLCATPQERLYRDGRWQEGLLPQGAVSAAELAQYQRFFDRMEAFRRQRDSQGRRAFALPMALSSRDAALLVLDTISMHDWLLAQGFDSPHLQWYVNYTCRDDYGASSAAVSAWAGIHYFACRDGEAQNASSDTVLTAPEGNAWLARGMLRSIRERAGDRLLGGALAFRVAGGNGPPGGPIEVDLWLPGESRTVRVVTEQLIWAAPLFLLPHVFSGYETLKSAARSYSYAPWLVANLTLSRFPDDRRGAPRAWDNVLYDSSALGYVVATHQQMRVWPGATVLTYYRAFDDMSPQQGRQMLRDTPREVWAERIFAELERPHPNIRLLTTRLDVFRNGHAMARPTPGLIWGTARARFEGDGTRLRFAHADVSGFSLFEEAQYRGVLAGERTLRQLGVRHSSSLT
ncbi:FAD-dependent oxidoreductase [Accumulibacter sp.]|uniref:FAD-dependent oxidoreductase n=1 Tax=Accumulibacter sp. TaxID=2053492 RepID=UPI0028C488E3|nr:FAD-dependent oxidoreductase [Accumulibacter sp.]